MLTVIPGVFHYLVGLLMQRYRITDAAYRQLLGELNVKIAPAKGDSTAAATAQASILLSK